MKKLFCALFIGAALNAFSQVESPPSLLLGLSGLTGEKGNIDVELLTEIISEKQSELKKEFIKRQFYDKLQNRNYVVWEFAYNTLEVLLNSSNKQAIEKEVLEYSANLSLVYAFAETYLQVSDNRCNEKVRNLLKAFYKNDTLANYFSCGNKINLKNKLWLSLLKSSKSPALNSIFLDLVYDVLRQNGTLKKLGFFQSQLPLGEEFYEAHNQYRIAMKDKTLSGPLDSLRIRMEKEAGILIDYYYVIKLAVSKNVRLDTLSKSTPAVLISPSDHDTLFKDLSRISDFIKSSNQPKDTTLSRQISKALGAFIDFNERSSSKNYRPNDLYYLQEVTGPLVVKLVTEYGFDSKYLGVVDMYRQDILHKLLEDIKTKVREAFQSGSIADKGATAYDTFNITKELHAVDYQQFVEMLSSIYKLDQAGTYEGYLKTLRTVSELFDDRNISRMVFNLADFLEKYTILEKEKNAIRVDVEEIILQLLKKYEARSQNNTVNFYFSIGIHQTMNIHYSDTYELQSDSAVLNNLSFASEKIGVKIKLRDWRRIRSYEYGETFDKTLKGTVKNYNTRKPLVNDMYLLVYGSGILYNIVNTTTGKDFTYPMLGTGIGIAFYNSLDFNLFYSSPLVSGEEFWESLRHRQMFGFSFDIKLGEYISAARKKRTERKAKG